MRRATVLLLVLGTVTILATGADARGRGAGSGPAGGMRSMWGDSSGVSAELREKIQKDQQALMAETLDLRTQLFEKTERFQLLMGDPKAKDEDILKLQQDIHNLKGQLAQKHLQHMLRIRKELPEDARAGFLMMGPGCGMGPCGRMEGMGPGPMHGHGKGHGRPHGHGRGSDGPMM